VSGLLETQVVITGRIDLACRGETGLEIIDFKVRSRKGFDALQPALQVQIYGLACQEARKVKVGKLVVHLLTEPTGSELEEYQWNNDLVASAWQKVNAGVRGIMNRIFEPTPGKHCMFCDFQNLCPVEQSLPSTNRAPQEIDAPSIGACP
jgi:CRISPR/Cas system-associated exonuclease Cas4 (RecB family)